MHCRLTHSFCPTGEIIPLEEKKPDLKIDKKKGSRLVREEDAGDDEVSDDERVDMNAITGAKEREERRDQFYAAENDCMCLLLLSFGKTTILYYLQTKKKSLLLQNQIYN